MKLSIAIVAALAVPASADTRAEFVITRDDPFVDVPHTVDASQPQRTLKLCAPDDAVKVQPK